MASRNLFLIAHVDVVTTFLFLHILLKLKKIQYETPHGVEWNVFHVDLNGKLMTSPGDRMKWIEIEYCHEMFSPNKK